MPDFIPGLDLCGLFYAEVVKPLLDHHVPGLTYSAALIGSGSEVLGYDTPHSTDHEWGPRLMLFLAEADHAVYARQIRRMLSEHLPHRFHGFSTHFSAPDADGVQVRQDKDSGPVNHMVGIGRVRTYLEAWLGFDPRDGMVVGDWLSTPQQRLLELTAGRVYHDGLGELIPLQEQLAYYPHDVWLYQLAAGWQRIDREAGFVGRAGDVGDELGSTVIAARLVRDVMRLCFLLERQYAPYSKWLGTAFARLVCGPYLRPVLERVLRAATWPEREAHLLEVYNVVRAMHDTLRITPPIRAEVVRAYDRPYRAIQARRFADAIWQAIRDPAVLSLDTSIGGVDQWSDSTDLLTVPKQYRKLRVIYERA